MSHGNDTIEMLHQVHEVIREHDGGIVIIIVERAGDVEVREGMTATIQYQGELENGQLFDSNEHFSFTVGDGSVIAGLDTAVRHLKVGNRAIVEIRHDFGYGEHGILGKIPPYASLKFTLRVLSAVAATEAPTVTSMLALPESESRDERSLVVGGDSISLDELGPIVVNSDGTLTRIANWRSMTLSEQETCRRRIVKRNKERSSAP